MIPKLEQLKNQASKVYALNTQVGLEYTNKIGDFATSRTNEYYSLRDSLAHRLSSVIFHIENLIDYDKNLPLILDKIHYSGNDDTLLPFLNLSQKLTYLFEDVIFHICSLFDYIGNLMCYAVIDKRLSDWGSTVKASSRKEQK